MEKVNFNPHILVVDDSKSILDLIEYYLLDLDFKVTTAQNGQEALEFFDTVKPDLVLTDLEMPIMGGLKLLEALKKRSPNTPVIVISGKGDLSDAIDALRLGAWDYIVKPFTLTLLEHVVCRALEQLRLVIENTNQRLALEENNLKLAQNLEQIRNDQKAGRNVQQLLLPKSTMEFQGFTLSYKVIPSLYLSGDFADYFNISKDKFGFYIADVSGHGASSAFVTVLLKAYVAQMLDNYNIGYSEAILHPEQVLKHISDDILNAKLGKYLTMIFCVVDFKENTLTYSIGGHYPMPLIWDGKKTTFLTGEGYAVGIHKNAVYHNYKIDLPPQFVMALFSDGIFEIMNGKNLKENEEKLLSLIDSPQLQVEELLMRLGLKNCATIPDDISLLLMNRNMGSTSLQA